MGQPVQPQWEQEDYAFYTDGSETGAVIIGTVGTQQTLTVDTAYHCRLAISDTNLTTNNASIHIALTILWQYSVNAGTDWLTITGATPVQFVDNGNLTDGEATTNRQPVGTGTFNAGRVYESADTATTVYTVPLNNTQSHTEVVLHLLIDSAQVTDAQEILIRAVHGDGTAFTTYVNADINVDDPGATHYTLTAESGTYTITGTAVALTAARQLIAGSGTFSITGTDVDFIHARFLVAGSGTFTVTGTAVTLDYASIGSGAMWVEEALFYEPNLWIPGKKPVGPVKIDWEHPYAKGLQGYYILNRHHREHDVMTGSGGTLTGDPFGVVPNEFYADIDVRKCIFDRDIAANITSEYTFMVRFKNPVHDAGSSRFIMGGYTSANYDWGLYLNSDGSSVGFFGAVGVKATAISNLNRTDIFTLVGTSDGTTITAYPDGNTVAHTNMPHNYSWNIGDSWYNGAQELVVYMTAMWDRHMSPTEVNNLIADPYQFLMPA